MSHRFVLSSNGVGTHGGVYAFHQGQEGGYEERITDL